MDNGKELIMVYNTDIKELFMSDIVEEILITTDSDALTLDESSQVGDIDWFRVIEMGVKKIVVGLDDRECELFSYDKVTAVIVRYLDVDDVETFINEKHKLIFKR